MAIGVFKLSKKNRFVLSMIFLTLSAVQVFIGLTMVALAMYIFVNVAPVLFSERAEITFVFFVVAFSGTSLAINYLMGMKIGGKCMEQAHKKSTRTFLMTWTCISFYIIVYLLVLASQTRKEHKHIIRSMKHSLHIGMQRYLKNETWKITIDRLQTSLQCCGIHSYEDWHSVPYMDQYVVNNKSPTTNELRLDGTWNMPVTPWSCCKIVFPVQCLHDPLQQVKSAHVWKDQPQVAKNSVNNGGCLELLKGPIYGALVTFIMLVVLAFLVQVAIFLASRILYTSCRNAILLNDPDGISPGWIFGRGDCGYTRGKTVADIMGVELCSEKEALLGPGSSEYNQNDDLVAPVTSHLEPVDE